MDTYEPHGDGGDTIPAIGEEDRLVAMVNVPAEQVPEGILTFCRSWPSYHALIEKDNKTLINVRSNNILEIVPIVYGPVPHAPLS